MDDEGEYVCSEEGWEEGRTSVDDKEWTASGVVEDEDAQALEVTESELKR
jgi:hypothetical protein